MSVELLNSNQNNENLENNFSNTDAELALIGCILWDNRNYEKISDFLNHNHFVDETNKIIFSTIKNLLDNNILVSPITLKNYLPEDKNNFNSEIKISEIEIEFLYELILLRISISILKSSLNEKYNPDNKYLQVSKNDMLLIFDKWADISQELATYFFRNACGFTPIPNEKNFKKFEN